MCALIKGTDQLEDKFDPLERKTLINLIVFNAGG